MATLSLTQAVAIADAALQRARELGLQPITVTVLDPGGHPQVLKREDGSAILRPNIAYAKAWGTLGMGVGGAALAARAANAPAFYAALNEISGGRMAPSRAGVLIGLLELLAALGLVLPALLNVAPGLVPFAALGLAAIMLGAAITHARRKEPPLIAVNLVLFALAAFVAWGRFGRPHSRPSDRERQRRRSKPAPRARPLDRSNPSMPPRRAGPTARMTLRVRDEGSTASPAHGLLSAAVEIPARGVLWVQKNAAVP